MNTQQVSGNRIIRIYEQDLHSEWYGDNGIQRPGKSISPEELFQDLKDHGFEIIQYAYSSFGAMYFIEVNGNYSGVIPYQTLDTAPEKFNWYC